jgi:hypothetical protein
MRNPASGTNCSRVFTKKDRAVPAKRARQPRVQRPVGRPAFVPTPEQRIRVKVKAFARTREQKIAADLGIDPKTLRKHFREELANGRADVRAMVWERQVTAALTGTNPTDRYYVLNNPDDGDIVSVPPPPLNISFADGGPGRVRRVPFALPDDSAAGGISETPDYKDVLGDHIETAQNRLPSSPPVQQQAQPITPMESRRLTSVEQFQWLADPSVVAVVPNANASEAERDAVLRHLRAHRVLT